MFCNMARIELQRPLAFVLGGGGARGAFQAGALRALFEAGIKPDILVGTSIGGLNAAYLALHGLDDAGLMALEAQWKTPGISRLFPTYSPYILMRVLFNRLGLHGGKHVRAYYETHGITPDLHFSDIAGVKLYLVASDLNTGTVASFGEPEDSLLQGIMATTALPPWVHPLETDGKFLIDGGAMSNLPIEVAYRKGAREIIALDLSDMRDIAVDAHGFSPFYTRFMTSTDKRLRDLETALVQAHGVPVHTIELRGEEPLSILDFNHAVPAIAQGYSITKHALKHGLER